MLGWHEFVYKKDVQAGFHTQNGRCVNTPATKLVEIEKNGRFWAA
jgi:hypothetical protein